MTLFKDHLRRQKLDKDSLLETTRQIKDFMTSNYTSQTKHPPTLIYGANGSGKTTLLTHLYEECETLFKKPVLRIIRFSASTPRSAYNLELLRVACQQISIILKIPEGYLPKDASFDPLYINNWFQSLLRRCEDMDNEILMIFIDNIHKVNPLECDIVNGLSWVPMMLPKNVFFVCTSSVPIEQLQFTPAQKEKLKSTGCYYQLSGTSMVESSEKSLDSLESRFGKEAFARLARYLTCAEFGLTETELLELLMPTSNLDALINLEDGDFNFSTLCAAKRQMGKHFHIYIIISRFLTCFIYSPINMNCANWAGKRMNNIRASIKYASIHINGKRGKKHKHNARIIRSHNGDQNMIAKPLALAFYIFKLKYWQYLMYINISSKYDCTL